MIAVLALFVALTGAAFWACRRDRYLFWVGFWIATNCAVSNAIQFILVMPAADRLAAAAQYKPGPFTFLEGMTAVAAFFAWSKCRERETGSERWLIALVIANGLSICFNFMLATYSTPTPRQVSIYEGTTNIIFAVECLLAFGVGVADGVRTGRFARWPSLGRRSAQQDAVRAKGDAAP